MPWNGSGVFSRVRNWVADKNNGIKIVASLHDQEDDNLTSGIQACLTKNNENKPSSDFQPGSDAAHNLGGFSLRWLRGFFSGSVRIFNGATNYVDLSSAALSDIRNQVLPDKSGNVVLDTTDNVFTGENSYSKRPVLGPVGIAAGDAGGVLLKELAANGSDAITLKGADDITAYTLSLPASQGASGTTLTNDGSGNLTWQSPASIFAPIGVNSGDGGRIQLQELAANGAAVIRIKAADSIGASFDLTMPAALPVSNGAGLSFSTDGSASFTTSPVATRQTADESAFIFNLLNLGA